MGEGRRTAKTQADFRARAPLLHFRVTQRRFPSKFIENRPFLVYVLYCKKASKKVRLRNMIPREAKLQLYKSTILANLAYCHIVWHFCKASHARKLERVQERALHAVYNDRSATYEELLEKGRLSSLENRRLQDILILMYKVKNSLAPEHVCNMFFQQDKHYNLRSDFPVPRYNTVKYGKHSIRYLGPHIWGKISQELRSKTSLQAFRRGLRALNALGLLDGTCGCCT